MIKSFPEEDLEETLNWINKKLIDGQTIDDALMFIRCYGAIDELLRRRKELQQDENEIPVIVNGLMDALDELDSEFTNTTMEFTRGGKRYYFVCGLRVSYNQKEKEELQPKE